MKRDSGASIRVYNLAKGLFQLGNEVKVIIPSEAASVERIDGIEVNHIRGFLPTSFLNFFRKFVGVSRPTALYFYDFVFILRSARLLKKVDVVQIEQQTAGALFAIFIRRVLKKPVVLDCHDVFQAIRVKHTSFVRKVMETFQEKLAYKFASLILTVSETEKNVLLSYGVDSSKIESISNGVDTDFFKGQVENNDVREKYDLGNSQVVVFVGNMEYLPNREAVEFLSSSIVPKVLDKIKNVKFLVVGKTSQMKKPSNLIFTGLIDDVSKVLAISDVAVAPLSQGSGTRLKIVEYFSSGLPVVSTSIGAEGLEYTDEVNIIIADNADRFSSAIVRLLKDKDLRINMGIAARTVARDKYDWQILSKHLNEVIKDTISENA